jgi:hypothetical protein
MRDIGVRLLFFTPTPSRHHATLDLPICMGLLQPAHLRVTIAAKQRAAMLGMRNALSVPR